MPTKNIPSKTPAPPIDKDPLYFKAFLRFKISPPIKTPIVPAIKAQGAAKSGAKSSAKIAEKIGGSNAGILMPTPGTILAKNFETTTIKKVAIKTGVIANPDIQIKYKK